MAERRRRHTWHYRPGEMVVAVHLTEASGDQQQAHTLARETLEQQLAGRTGGLFSLQQSRQAPIVFRAPNRPPLAFLFFDLESPEHENVKKAIFDVQSSSTLDRLRERGLTPRGIMPHWLASAQQDFSDGSPATLPVPTKPRRGRGPWRYRYTSADRALDFRPRLTSARRLQPVRVLILDTPPDWRRAQRQAERFGDVNGQLPELLEFLGDTALPDWHSQALGALDSTGLRLARTPDGRGRNFDFSDHALFISGLIHDLAPTSPIGLRPVLTRYGVGDLHLFLQVLRDALEAKPEDEPLIVNISLGFMPKPEYVPWLWYGIRRPNDPDFVGDVGIRDEPRDQSWLVANRTEVERTRGLLQGGVTELGAYLLGNNCFGVAAAGNDSLNRVLRGAPRFGPRFPARDGAMLGVAATMRDPEQAAPYSNVGEEIEVGDHVATFGGGVRPDPDDPDTPRDGVIGVFTDTKFPSPERGSAAGTNDNGWAEWSGTSFATAIASGLAAGYWTLERVKRPTLGAGEVLSEFHRLAPHYAAALRTPSIAITGEWQQVTA